MTDNEKLKDLLSDYVNMIRIYTMKLENNIDSFINDFTETKVKLFKTIDELEKEVNKRIR